MGFFLEPPSAVSGAYTLTGSCRCSGMEDRAPLATLPDRGHILDVGRRNKHLFQCDDQYVNGRL